MKNNEIFQKVIQKARENGYKEFLDFKLKLSEDRFYSPKDYNGCCYNGIEGHINEIIFSHEFSKAFWKNIPVYTRNITQPSWAYYLSRMVLQDEPLKYLGRFL